MGLIRVVTDSACDLTPSQIDEQQVRVVPLTIRFGNEELVDRIELSTKEFWDRVIASDTIPATAAPSPGAFQQEFESAADEGADGVICINLSSKLSATYQSARTAAAAVSGRIPVEVVDSLQITAGQGLLVLAAARAAQAGATLAEVAAEVNDLRDRSKMIGLVGSLEFLRRGGRIGNAAHLLGSLLSIKPVIELRDGAVEVESKQRTRGRALQYVAAQAASFAPVERIGVANGAADDFEQLLDALRQVETTHPLVVSDLGPVIGSHAGPGTVVVGLQLRR